MSAGRLLLLLLAFSHNKGVIFWKKRWEEIQEKQTQTFQFSLHFCSERFQRDAQDDQHDWTAVGVNKGQEHKVTTQR